MTVQSEQWQQEISRLAEVRVRIGRRIGELREIADERMADIAAVRRNFWDDISVNVENEDDAIETAASIAQQAQVLKRQERDFKVAEQGLLRLERLVEAPYFGRIDFVEEGSAETEPIYIGVSSFIDPQTDEIWIYDWRAPIASMFYDYPPGPAAYTTPVMTVEGELKLKRQYIIRDGKLEHMFDTGLSIGDEMLQQMLGRSADEKMRSIVTTIQREQNQIIRDDRHKVLIVQGAAGSGKTSVALQRIAYLLYKYRETLSADNMLLFSPNSLFSDYVSNVLPELGEANMQQTTFQEHLRHELEGMGLSVEDPYDQLEFILSGEANAADYEIRMYGVRYKASAAFLNVVDAYGELLKQEGLLFNSFAVGEKVLISGEQIAARFYAKPSTLPLGSRMEAVSEWLLEKLENIESDTQQRIYRRMLKETRYIGTEQEMKRMSFRRAHKAIGPLMERARKLEYIDVLGLYKRLYEDHDLFAELVKAAGEQVPDQWDAIRAYTLEKLEQGEIVYEDATPLVYLKGLIQGVKTANTIRYVVVDEAQDYSPFQYAYMRKLFPRARFTLLGDWNQGIYTHANRQGGYSSISELTGEDEAETIRLVKSYRSTREIVEFATRILPEGEPVEPFSRSGEPPRVIQAATEEELDQLVSKAVAALGEQGMQSLAILCKNEEETRRAYDRLQGKIEGLALITKDMMQATTGVWLLPAYLAKGLEFDGVILYNAGKAHYAEDRERKLFYTACTRALHRLHVYYTGELTPFLSEAGKF